MAIDIHDFLGVAPALTPWKLPLGLAQIALNINPDSKTIKPWRDPLQVSTGYAAAGKTTIYRFGRTLVSDTQYWFQWAKDVDVVKSPVVGDTTERTFFTGDGVPKWTNSTLATTGGPPYPASYRYLGVARPSNAPTMTVSGSAASADYQLVGYAYTNVTAYGEESAPSPICTPQKVFSGQSASCSGFDAAPSGAYDACTARRLYRSVTGSNDTNLYFVKEVPVATSTIADDVGSNIGEVIQTTSWDPPSPTMFGLTSMANGILIGFDGNDVCPSAQYAPYAWPKKWKLSTDFPIVGGRAMGNQCAVLTLGNPYLLSGSTPDALSLTRIDSPEACVSKRSIVNVTAPMPSISGADVMVGTVYYASQNGLCAMDSGGNVRNVLNGIMNRADWQALDPTSIQGYAYNGRYLFFWNNGSAQGGFVYDPRGGSNTLMQLATYATGGFYDVNVDHLSLQIGTNIVSWNGGSTSMVAVWRSGVIETPMQTMAFAYVLAAGYGGSVVFRLYAPDSAVYPAPLVTVTAPSNRPFRLPADDKYFRWEIEITSAVEVYEVCVASGNADLRASGNT